MNNLAITVPRLLASALAGAALFTALGTGSARAQVMLKFPGDSPGGPFYARVESPFVFHTDQYAAIVFYRDPDCVPGGFNLLNFFDAPAAFACPLTVSGFELWDKGPGSDAGPKHAISSGLAVPVWFVSWPELQAAMGDGVLTISELKALPTLMKGVAKTFHEVLNPSVPPGAPGGAQVPHLTITAFGGLPDGRTFQYEFTDVFLRGERKVAHVRIAFR